MSETTTPEQPALPLVKLALVIDNEVVDILHTDERLSAILLSNPIIIDVSENFYNEENRPTLFVGATYNETTKTFNNVE
jgi:hypothetical protein